MNDTSQNHQKGYPVIDQISVADLKSAMDAGPVRLIDVREKVEFDSGHLPGAAWIPMSIVPLRKDEFRADEPVYVVCRTGNRSGQVVMWLANQGIQTINVAGGTVSWQNQGFPIELETAERSVR
jgi:rhodanese-related sulfurtransferase